jgi:hypothetical protein
MKAITWIVAIGYAFLFVSALPTGQCASGSTGIKAVSPVATGNTLLAKEVGLTNFRAATLASLSERCEKGAEVLYANVVSKPPG